MRIELLNVIALVRYMSAVFIIRTEIDLFP